MSNTTQVTTSEPSHTTTAPKVKLQLEVGRFQGAFAGFGNGAFNWLKAYGCSEQIAHKIASDYMSDVARGMADGNLEIASAVSKAKKNGESTITFSGKSAAVTQTYAMSLIRICKLMDAAISEKLHKSRIPLHEMPLKVELAEYLEECEDWATRQEWKVK